jgi:hypothetical protein
VSLDDCGIVKAIRVPERNLARALLGPNLASLVDELAYPVGGRIVRDAMDPDVYEVPGNRSNTFDPSEARKQIAKSVLHLRRRFNQPAGEDASLRFPADQGRESDAPPLVSLSLLRGRQRNAERAARLVLLGEAKQKGMQVRAFLVAEGGEKLVLDLFRERA